MNLFLQKHPCACQLGVQNSAFNDSRLVNAEFDSSAGMLTIDIEEGPDRSLQLS